MREHARETEGKFWDQVSPKLTSLFTPSSFPLGLLPSLLSIYFVITLGRAGFCENGLVIFFGARSLPPPYFV